MKFYRNISHLYHYTAMHQLTAFAHRLFSAPVNCNAAPLWRFSIRGFGNACIRRRVGNSIDYLTRFSSSSSAALVQPPLIQSDDLQAHTQAAGHVPDILQHHDYFSVRNLFTIRDLYNAGVHLGHKKGLRDEHMLPFIFGTRLGVDILDLDLTSVLLGDALNFLAHVAYREGVALFISRHRRTIPDVEKAARECGEYAHCRLWRGGTFTNSTIQYGAVTRLPDVCVFLSTEGYSFRQHVAVTETAKMNIPSIGVVDSRCDPRLITYPVPGNDDTPSAIRLYLELFTEAIKRGKSRRKLDMSESGQ